MKAVMMGMAMAAVSVAGVAQAEEGLDLAKKSGCLACHAVDKKVVGPAWKDVAARYKGKGDAKATLVDKIKKGGKGNWTDVTGGVAMPPYSPRVPDADIEKLVSFVLSL
ncbi:MAG: c-type cytochrome [Pseudomonadota bacterium]